MLLYVALGAIRGQMQRFKNILVVCDDEAIAEAAFDRVAWLAEANGAKVTLIDVIDASPGELSRLFSALPGRRGGDVEAEVIDAHRAKLEGLAEQLKARGADVTTLVRLGRPFIQIIRAVLGDGYDLVVKSAQATASAPFLLSQDMHLLRKCPCPVWILNSRADAMARRILAAVDCTPDDPVNDALNQTIMELATSLSEQDGARLDVLSVWNLPEESTLRRSRAKLSSEDIDALVARAERMSALRLDNLVERFDAIADRMRVLHIKGSAAEAIPDHVHDEGIDTIVMGTVARTGIAGFFIGNTAESVLSRVACSVLTVKPQGFRSPVTLEGEDGATG